MKIKTFQFLMSTYQGNFVSPHIHEFIPDGETFEDLKHQCFDNKIVTEEQIDKTINNWIADSKSEVIDIRINHYKVNRNHNADNIIAVYTLICKE